MDFPCGLEHNYMVLFLLWFDPWPWSFYMLRVQPNTLKKKKKKMVVCISFGHAHGMWKFPGQGLNPCNSGNPRHCSDDTRSLTPCPTRELLLSAFFKRVSLSET